MERSYLVLDLETVPDRSLHWDPARDGFPPPTHHRVVTLGVIWLDPELRFRRIGVFGDEISEDADGHEARVLGDFAGFVGRKRCHLVTYNGRTFDLPVLVNRCLKHGIPFAAYFSDRDYRYRYSDLGHLDLADVLTEHGAARRPALWSAAGLMGLPGRLAIDGSMIASLYDAGSLDQIQAHCLQDVVQTTFLLLRFELLRGRLDRETYRERATGLWDALREDDRVAVVLDSADRERVLLGGEGS
ncbi:MAG: ribonuclease H-like domain-containing protein [Myxococcales bacterium]|nr:ribonuclease H-like domain-containing protein [Myxococcales bacterium]